MDKGIKERAAEYLKKASVRGSILGLTRIAELLKAMGDPQEKMQIIHISGTNGKGSFGAMLGSILNSAGYCTGNFSSPSITGITDVFRVNGKEADETELAEVILDIAELCEKMDDKPTEFEILTAAAFRFFEIKKCGIALIECGMGGDTDSTNVISSPLLSVITNVQKDHCAILGNTLAEIASHKSGIIKKSCPVYYGGDFGEAYEVIKSRAEILDSKLYTADKSIISDASFTIEGLDFKWNGNGVHIPLAGKYQLDNAVNVLCAVEILRNSGISIPDDAVLNGLKKVSWHGRFEILRHDPYVIFDGSHNPEGIKYAAESIREYFPETKLVMLIGVMADKDYTVYPEMFSGLIRKAFAVRPDNKRALAPEILAETMSNGGIPAESFDDINAGVKAAYDLAVKEKCPMIALGSLYMYREFTESLSLLQ